VCHWPTTAMTPSHWPFGLPPCWSVCTGRVPTNLELSGNFVNLEKSGNLRCGQGIFYDVSHGSRLA